MLVKSRDRLVSAVVVDFRWSQDEILKRPERSEVMQFWETVSGEQIRNIYVINTIDSILLGRTSSPSGINEEMMVVKSSVSLLLRWTFRITSRAARSLIASRRASSKPPPLSCHPSKMRSRAKIPERRCHRFQSFRLLPQELHSSGVRRATWNQW
jgi:hypothetical protein